MRNLENKIDELQSKVSKYQLNIYQKILFCTLFCFSIMLIAGYVSYLLGFNIEIKDNENISNPIIVYMINSVLYYCCLMFQTLIICNIFDKKIFRYLIIAIPIIEICDFVIDVPEITTFLIPIIFILIVGKLNIGIRKTLTNFLIYFPIMCVYQIVSLHFKIGVFNFSYNEVSAYQLIMFSVDHFIFYIVLYALKGSENYAKAWKHILYSQKIDTPQEDYEDCQALIEFESLTIFQKYKTLILLSAFQFFQLFLILLVCTIGNVIIESLVIVFSYLMFTLIIKRRYHSNSLVFCSALTVFIFYIASRISPPLYISMFIPIIIGLLIAYSLYLLAVHIENYNYFKNKKLNEFDLNSCSIDELKAICNLVGIKPKDMKFCEDVFISKLSTKELSEIYNIELQSVRNKKCTLSKKIKSLNSTK